MAVLRTLVMLAGVLNVGDAAGPRASTAPATSLMQSGSQNKKVSLMAEGESMLAGGSVSHALAGFQKFTDDLVEQYKKSGQPLDDTTKDAIQTVITYIHGMHPRLVRWHEIDVNRTEGCSGGKYNRCVKDYLVDQAAVVNASGEEVITKRGALRNCAQNAWDDGNQADDDCKDYDRYRWGQDPYEAIPNLPSCLEEMNHLDNAHISTSDKPKRTDMEVCLQAMKDWFVELRPRQQKCPYPRGGEQSACLQEQTLFEAQHCDWSEEKRFDCNAFNSCLGEVEDDCGDEFCTQIETNIQARKAENETGERIICLLDVLVNSSNASKPGDLEACKDKTYDTSEFNLDCPADAGDLTPIPVEFQECNLTNFEPHPCAAAFLVNEYRLPAAPLSMDKVIEICDCTACISIPDSTPPPPFIPLASGEGAYCAHVPGWGQSGILSIEPHTQLRKVCAASCGECGGEACGSRPGGVHQCCFQKINRVCESIDDTVCVVPESS